MARKPKKPKPQLDRAQEKARKQKRLAAVLGGVLVLVLVFEVPHTMKLMNQKAKAPVVTAAGTAPQANPTATPSSTSSSPPTSTPSTPTTPSVQPLSTSGLVSSVQVTPDPGQLTEFAHFASKDPFSQQIQKTGAATGGGTTDGTGAQPAATTPKTPPAPPPTSAVISLNGTLTTVSVGGAFPSQGTIFDRVGALFELKELTATSAKIAIVGGSYADGVPTITLTVGKPVTLQNTADGTRYTLLLEAQGTQVPTTSTPTAPATTATTTTPSVVPPAPSG